MNRNSREPISAGTDWLLFHCTGLYGDLSLQQATSGMVRWLERDYGLNANESAMLLGFAVKYDVVDLVGTQVSIASKLPKVTLASFAKK